MTRLHTVFSGLVARVARVLLVGGSAQLIACGGSFEILSRAPAPSAQVPAGYVLVWADEFTSSGEQLPDSTKWAYDTDRNKLGWYNNEKQYYANARLQNSKVSGGQLVITARKETLNSHSDWGRQSYTSARLITKGKASWTYGFFEARAKLPCAKGTWPAIWTLGAWTDTWPLQGEIDIMEQTGWDKTKVSGTVHTESGSGGAGSTGNTSVPDACGAFHNYQVTWTPQFIRFSVDGVTYRTDYTNPGTGNNTWPFDKPQYLILNLAMGGDLGGAITDSMLPATFEIDYVRVYQKP
jgi:beta-glucanase (GH16 family)